MDCSSNLFANDGSFLERFKQLQDEQTAMSAAKDADSSASGSSVTPKTGLSAKSVTFMSSGLKSTSQQTKTPTPPPGRLAFSLRQKPKSVINPLKLGDDEDDNVEDAEQPTPEIESKGNKITAGSNSTSSQKKNSIPSPPSDPEVKKVAEKLARFVAKNGRGFEDLTRTKNSQSLHFRFLFDLESPEYKYYNYCVRIEEEGLKTDANRGNIVSSHSSPKRGSKNLSYLTPASALYASTQLSQHPTDSSNTDSLSMMEFYMKKAAEEDLRKPIKRHDRDEILLASSGPPPKKGHHMGDYIPQEELEKFLAKCNSQDYSKEAEERAKIQPDNVGHRLLSKMGWKEGEGLGNAKGGRANPVEAGAVKVNNLGVGAVQPGEVTPDDDIYEQYKKRMMLGYRHRPNPLNNPRKAYY